MYGLRIERDKEVAELRKKYCYDPNTTLEVYHANFGPRFELTIKQEHLPNNKKKVLEQMGYQYKGYHFIKSERKKQHEIIKEITKKGGLIGVNPNKRIYGHVFEKRS